LQVFLFYKIYP